MTTGLAARHTDKHERRKNKIVVNSNIFFLRKNRAFRPDDGFLGRLPRLRAQKSLDTQLLATANKSCARAVVVVVLIEWEGKRVRVPGELELRV